MAQLTGICWKSRFFGRTDDDVDDAPCDVVRRRRVLVAINKVGIERALSLQVCEEGVDAQA